MKRAGGLVERIADWKNVCNAYGRAIRHKSRRPEVVDFKRKAKSRLWRIRQNILSGRFCLGRYWHFTIFDPKEREIYAAPLRQRIIHQAFIGVLGEYLERPLIADTYACRRGFGQWKAVYRAYGMARRFGWVLKLDIRHYFDSIDHEVMYGMLKRLFKDRLIMEFWRQVIDSYCVTQGKGLPIGNLTSQYMANLYLGIFDRHFQGLGRGYVRYMDDILIFGEKEDLKAVLREAGEFLESRLRLEIKHGGSLHRTCKGVNFLGCRIFPGKVWLARRSRIRLAKKFRACNVEFLRGDIDERTYADKARSLFAFATNVHSFSFRRMVLERERENLEAIERRVEFF